VNPRTRRQQIEELDALLEGRLAPEDASASTARLLSVATAVLERDPLPTVELGADRKAAMRQQLLADIAALPVPVAERTREALAPRMRRAATQARVAVASTMAASMVGATGVAVAAQEALPGDALYGVKKATESLRLSLAGDHVSVGRLELRFAEERLEEVIAGSQDQRVASSDDLIAALGEMDERSLSGAEALVRVAERDVRPELLEEVAAFTDRQASALAASYADLPADVRPHAEDSLSVLRRIRIELLIPAIERCDCIELAGASTSLTDEGGEVDGPDWFRSATLPLPPLGSSDDLLGTRDGAASDPDLSAEASLDDATGGSSTSSSPRISTGITDVGSTVGDTTEQVVEDTTDTVEKVVEDTTDTVDKVVEDTTGTVDKVTEGDLGGAVDEVVEDTLDTGEKVIEDTLDTGGKLVDDTTSTLDGLLGP
jgi:hypothetical protein